MLVGALVMWLAMRANQVLRDLHNRSDDLEQRLSSLRDEIKHLRLTHSEVAAIEDVTANLIAAQIDAEAMLARHATAYRILLKLREGPHAYKNNEWESDSPRSPRANTGTMPKGRGEKQD